MSVVAKVEFDLDIDKLAKAMISDRFGTAAKGIKVSIVDRVPVKKVVKPRIKPS